MTIIQNLIENIYRYGNCEIYFPTTYHNETTTSVLMFNINSEGNLEIKHALKAFTKPIWNNTTEPTDDAYQMGEIAFYQYKEEDLPRLLSTITYLSLKKAYDNQTKVALAHNLCEEDNLNTNEATRKLFESFLRILDINEDELKLWTMLNEVGVQRMLAKKMQTEVEQPKINYNEMSDYVARVEFEALKKVIETEMANKISNQNLLVSDNDTAFNQENVKIILNLK